jgi:hypothetical protein
MGDLDTRTSNALCVHDWVGDDECAYCEADQLRAALIVSRGQWIHSVNAQQCLAALGERPAHEPPGVQVCDECGWDNRRKDCVNCGAGLGHAQPPGAQWADAHPCQTCHGTGIDPTPLTKRAGDFEQAVAEYREAKRAYKESGDT